MGCGASETGGGSVLDNPALASFPASFPRSDASALRWPHCLPSRLSPCAAAQDDYDGHKLLACKLDRAAFLECAQLVLHLPPRATHIPCTGAEGETPNGGAQHAHAYECSLHSLLPDVRALARQHAGLAVSAT